MKRTIFFLLVGAAFFWFAMWCASNPYPHVAVLSGMLAGRFWGEIS